MRTRTPKLKSTSSLRHGARVRQRGAAALPAQPARAQSESVVRRHLFSLMELHFLLDDRKKRAVRGTGRANRVI